MFGFGPKKEREISVDLQRQQLGAQHAKLTAQIEGIDKNIAEYNTNFDSNILKIESYLKILESVPAASALPTATSATPAAESVTAEKAETALTAIVSDIKNYTTKSPLAYLLKTNKELIANAKIELENIKKFKQAVGTRKVPIQYARDASLPKRVSRGGGAKTMRNRKSRSS